MAHGHQLLERIGQAIDARRHPRAHVERARVQPDVHLTAQLAAHVAQIDHMLEGRFYLGIGPGGLRSDWEVFEKAFVSRTVPLTIRVALSSTDLIVTTTGSFVVRVTVDDFVRTCAADDEAQMVMIAKTIAASVRGRADLIMGDSQTRCICPKIKQIRLHGDIHAAPRGGMVPAVIRVPDGLFFEFFREFRTAGVSRPSQRGPDTKCGFVTIM